MLKYNKNVPYLSKFYNAYSTTKLIKTTGELPSQGYQPAVVERNKFEKWKQNEIFKSNNDDTQPRYSMVLPPPNVTGKLHLGHALTCTIQDVIVRRQRSLGKNVLWLPGIDHAGIATQGVVEKYLKMSHNIDRKDMSREAFNKEIWKWKEMYGSTICEQLCTLGSSLDWSRKIFTMEPKHSHAVETAFIRLFKKGLIYRKKALVNWCNKLQSTVSDIEVENIVISKPTEVQLPSYDTPVKFGLIYDFAYKVEDSNEVVVVSTTMPETMLGDVAVAVHPNDERYKYVHGKRVIHPFRKTSIPVILDEFVDMKFGTGAVKITPAHSKIDYEVAKRHNLPLIEVINESGRMKNANEFNNLNKYECRVKLLKKLDDLGLLQKANVHEVTLPVCSRTGDVIEYLPKEQWFVSCSKLNKHAAEAVKSGNLSIEPKQFIKNWLNWTEDDRDWCISRQLWWGHQIPAYKCYSGDETVWVAAYERSSALSQASKLLGIPADCIIAEQDTDVLDTWFSSGIYPFSSLGWPESTQDLKTFYPLDLMATGHDILGFWVHRMVILGLELTDKLPFNKILLHGVICDNKGVKMSKSKGNVIDPIDVINGITLDQLNDKTKDMLNNGLLNKDEFNKAKDYHRANFARTNGIPECGVDALRFTLVSQNIKSHYINFNVDLCHTNKLFCNKIWQSIKYLQLSLDKLGKCNEEITIKDLTYFDNWILSRLSDMVFITNMSLDKYDFHIATKSIKSLIYNEFCDVYLEATKIGFDGDNMKVKLAHAHTLIAVLNVALRCLSPFMVYITDEIIHKIPAFETNIIHNFNDLSQKYFDFPTSDEFSRWRNEQHERQVENYLNCIVLTRQLKGCYNIPNKPRTTISIRTNDKTLQADIIENQKVFKHLTKCGEIIFEDVNRHKEFVSAVASKDTVVSVQVIGDNITDTIETTRNRVSKKITKIEESISKLEVKFLSTNYMKSVPILTQNLEKQKLLSKKEELKLLQRLVMCKS